MAYESLDDLIAKMTRPASVNNSRHILRGWVAPVKESFDKNPSRGKAMQIEELVEGAQGDIMEGDEDGQFEPGQPLN